MLASLAASVAFVLRSLGRTADGEVLATLFDDAMISMTYARNLADGHGLVWNAGEPAVEGYSNTLWTVVMAVVHLLPLPDRLMALPVSLLGVGLVAAAVVLAHHLARELVPDRPGSAVASAWAVAALYPLTYWTLRGMEVGLVAVLTAAAALLAVRLDRRWTRADARWLAVVLAAIVLVRDDSIVVAVVTLGFLAWRRRAVDGRQVVARIAAVAVPALVAIVAHEVARVALYGDLLPNTYYLKVEGVSLLTRVDRGLRTALRLGMVPALVVLALAVLGARRDRLGRSWLPVLLGAAGFAYSVAVGGDAWEFMPYPNRYVTSVLPVLVPVAVIGADGLVRRARAEGVVGVVAVPVLALVLAPPWVHWASTGGEHVSDDAFWAREGIAVRDHTPAGTRVAVVVAGNGPYFARRPAIDLLGKSDPVVAHAGQVGEFRPGHSKRDLGHSIGDLRPDLVLRLWYPTGEELDLLRSLGYVQLEQLWFRPDRLDLDEVRPILEEPLGLRVGDR